MDTDSHAIRKISKEEKEWFESEERAILVKQFDKKFYQSKADNEDYQRRQGGGSVVAIIGWLLILASLYISLA